MSTGEKLGFTGAPAAIVNLAQSEIDRLRTVNAELVCALDEPCALIRDLLARGPRSKSFTQWSADAQRALKRVESALAKARSTVEA